VTIAFRSLSKTTSSGSRNRGTTRWIDTSRPTPEIRIIITISTVLWTRRFTSGCLITVSRSQARLFSASEGFHGLLFPLTIQVSTTPWPNTSPICSSVTRSSSLANGSTRTTRRRWTISKTSSRQIGRRCGSNLRLSTRLLDGGSSSEAWKSN
jgi:hypothetical protein